MVDEPAKHFAAVAAAGGDSVTFHIEAVDDVRATIRAAREQELQVGIAFNPETEPEAVVEFADAVDLVLCMSIHPGYSGQQFQAEAYERVRRLRASLPDSVADPGRRRDQGPQRQAALRRGRAAARRRVGDLRSRGPDASVSPARAAAEVSIGRALQLVDEAGPRGYPKPTVGAVVVRDGEIVGEGVTEPNGRHGEVVALAEAGERAQRRDALRDARAVRAPRHDAAVHGCDRRRRRRASRLRRPRSESRGRGRRGAAPGGGRRCRVRRLVRGARAERGVAHVGVAAASVRDLQGGDDARRPRDRAGAALGDRRGEPPTRARASRRRGRRRRRRAARCAPIGRSSTHATSRRRRASRGGSSSRAARPRPTGSRRGGGHSRRSSPRSRRRAFSRCCSRAARPSPLRSSPQTSSTRCSSSSLRPFRGTARRPSLRYPPPRTLSHLTSTAVGDDVLLEAYVHDP